MAQEYEREREHEWIVRIMHEEFVDVVLYPNGIMTRTVGEAVQTPPRMQVRVPYVIITRQCDLHAAFGFMQYAERHQYQPIYPPPYFWWVDARPRMHMQQVWRTPIMEDAITHLTPWFNE